MNNRRNFIKTMIAGAAGVTLVQNTSLLAKSKVLTKKLSSKAKTLIELPLNVVFSKENQGKWAKKDGSHAPVVTVKGNKVTIETKHGMNEKHFIVRHTLVSSEGEYIAAKTFYPNDKKAISTFDLPKGKKSFVATSYCNLHDLWITKFDVK